jgi:hypothetical protein
MWRGETGLADPVPLGGPWGLLQMGALGAAGRQERDLLASVATGAVLPGR